MASGVEAKRLVIVVAGFVTLVASGCTGTRSAFAPTETAVSPPPSPSNLHRPLVESWDPPFNGLWPANRSTEEAQRRVTVFTVVEPRALDHPTIYVAPTNDHVLYLYRTSDHGVVWILEKLPDIQGDGATRLNAWEALVADNGDPANISTAEVVYVRDNEPALLTYSNSNDPQTHPTLLEWVENRTQFSILGPEITPAQAESLANDV